MSTLLRVRQTHGSEQTDNMTSIIILEILLFILFHQDYCEELEPVLRAKGSVVEMGYCFGVDYVVVYRSAIDGDQLLGNSSDDATPITPPLDLQGRIRISKHQYLLGLQISNLTHMDSGIYRRECWQSQTMISQHTQELFVCDEEVKSEEIILREQDGKAELQCNSSSTGLEGTSVRWYHEIHPSYKLILFLDSSISLEPVVGMLEGVVEVRNRGNFLLLDNSLLKNNQHFYCLVTKGNTCLSFHSMYLPEHSESKDMFVSQGDRVVLNCPADGKDQKWATPMGIINDNSEKNNQMYISFDDKSDNFSLIIAAVSDEHNGDYSCISSSFELQYILVLCPKKESQSKVVFEDKNVSLECDAGGAEFQSIQWYRLQSSGGHELICDSKDENVSIPVDLRGRLTLNEKGSSLTISHLKAKDAGVFWCVALGGSVFLDGDVDPVDYDEEDTEDDDLMEEPFWHDTYKCIYKMETTLEVKKKTRGIEPVTFKPPDSSPEPHTTIPPSAAPNVTAYAVGAGVVGLLVVAGIAAAIAMKVRASSKSRNTSKDIKMNVDPGCTESLTHSDEHGA